MEFSGSHPNFDENNNYDEIEILKQLEAAVEIVNNGEILFNINQLEEAVLLALENEYPNQGLIIVNAVLEIAGYNSDFWQYKGTFLNMIEDYEDSYFAFEKSLELNPLDSEALYNFSSTLELLGFEEQAFDALQKANNLDNTNIEILLSLGAYYQKIEDWENATIFYEKVISLDNDVHEAWYELGFSYEVLDKLEKSLECYEKFLELEPDNYFGWYNSGIVQIRLGDFPKAIDHFEFSIVLNGDFPSAYFNLGIAQLSNEDYKAAIESFKFVLKSGDKDEAAEYYIGKSYFYMNKFRKAVTHFSRAIKIDDNYFEAYISRGKAYEKLGKLTQALEDFNKALMVSITETYHFTEEEQALLTKLPLKFEQIDYQKTIENIDTLINAEDFSSALTDINFAEQFFPDSVQLLLRKSLVHIEKGNFDEGLLSFKKALNLDTKLSQKINYAFAELEESTIFKQIFEDDKQ